MEGATSVRGRAVAVKLPGLTAVSFSSARSEHRLRLPLALTAGAIVVPISSDWAAILLTDPHELT